MVYRRFLPATTKFLHLFVILFTGGVSTLVHAGIPHPRADTPPGADTPQIRHPREQTPPPEQTHPWSRHPPRCRPPPKNRHPPKQTPQSRHPREQTPPKADTPGSRLRHTVNERLAGILLECILVVTFFGSGGELCTCVLTHVQKYLSHTEFTHMWRRVNI